MKQKGDFRKLNIVLVIHMDPINVDDEEVKNTKKQIEDAIQSLPNIKSLHDLRIVGEGEHKNIIFDVVIATNGKFTHKDEVKLKEDINKRYRNSILNIIVLLQWIEIFRSFKA